MECNKCGGKIEPTLLGKIYKCVECGKEYRIKEIQIKKWMKQYVKGEGILIKMPKRPFDFDINDKSTWSSKCCECGAKMSYVDSQINPRYVCKKCGNILEV